MSNLRQFLSTITSDSSETFTNKSGNISQWTNNSNYISDANLTVVGDDSTGVTFSAKDGDNIKIAGGTNVTTAVTGDTVTITGPNLSGYLTSIAADSINDTHIDWGTGANQVSTADVPEQTNLYYTDVRADARAQLKIDAIIDSAPGALDTLNELAASLGDDADFAGTVTTSLAGKEPTITAGATSQYWRGDKTWQSLNATNWNTAFGWGNHASGGYLTNTGVISSHTDVHNAVPTNGQVLKWDNGNSRWAPAADIDTDTVYSHPTSAGNKHIPTGGSSGQFLKYDSSGTAVWAADNDTIYSHPTSAGNKHIPTGGSSGQFLKYDSSGTAVWASDNDTVYSHPTSAGNKHIPTGGSSGQFLKYDSSGTAVWASDNDTTYTVGDGGLTQNNLTNTLKTNYDTAYGWGNHASSGYLTSTDVHGDINFSGNTISIGSSNANLELSASGTGNVIIQSIEINGNKISATDSTRIKFNDNIEVSNILFTDEGHSIGGSADPNQVSYNAGGGGGVHVFQGDVERLAGANLTTISDPDGSGTAAMIDTANGRNLVIHAGNGGDFNYSTLYLRGTKIELGEGTGQISIQENNITTTRSNDDLVLEANGTGKIRTNTSAITFGTNAGLSDVGTNAVLIGESAGQLKTGTGAIAIGYQASKAANPASYSIAIGYQAMATDTNAGGRGHKSIAIGYKAGQPVIAANQIVINATNNSLTNISGSADPHADGGCYIKPIRDTGDIASIMTYHPSSGEVRHNSGILVNDNLIEATNTNDNLQLGGNGTGKLIFRTPISLPTSQPDGSSAAIDLATNVAILDGNSSTDDNVYTLADGTYAGQFINLVRGTGTRSSIHVVFNKKLVDGTITSSVNKEIFSQYMSVIPCVWNGSAWCVGHHNTE